MLAIDTETTGTALHNGCKPFGISTCDQDGNTHWFEWPVNPKTRQPIVNQDAVDLFLMLVEHHDELIFHNAEFDIRSLETVGIIIPQVWDRMIDTAIESHIFHSENHKNLHGKLKPLALLYLDYDDDDEQGLRKAVIKARSMCNSKNARSLNKWKIADPEEPGDHVAKDYWLPAAVATELGYPDDHPWYSVCEKYGVGDAERTMMLHIFFQHGLRNDPTRLALIKKDCRVIRTIYRMRTEGLTLHMPKLRKEIKRYTDIVDDAAYDMCSISNKTFNPDSPAELSEVMFGKLKMPVVKRTKTGQPCTDASVRGVLLQTYGDKPKSKQAKFLTAWKTYKDCISGIRYLNSYATYQVDGVLRPGLNPTGTKTTRLSSSDPNGQNVSKGKELMDDEKPEYNLRAVFGPPKDYCWFCIDYSQLQIRIFAYLSGEQQLIDALNDGWDAHMFTATRIFEKDPEQITKLERRVAKNVNFGFIFGAGPAKIEQTAGVPGLWSTVTRVFPHAHAYMESIISQVRRKGYVTLPDGYRLYLPEKHGKVAVHAGVNYLVQGVEGRLVKRALIDTDEFMDSPQMKRHDGRLLFTVHDELIFRFKSTILKSPKLKVYGNTLATLMERPGAKLFGMNTPVDVEYTTKTWADSIKLVLD